MNHLELISYENLEFNDIESDTTNSCYQFPCKHSRDDQDDEFNYPPGSEEFKKARKRRQNRESAVRIRARKKLDECQIFKSLEVLKENTGKLKVENAHLKKENEVLQKQIALFKKLASQEPDQIKGDKPITQIEGENLVTETEGDNSAIIESPSKRTGGKGRNIAGGFLAIALLCIMSILRSEDSQPINTGGRSLAFSDSSFSTKPILMTILVIISGCLLKYLIAR